MEYLYSITALNLQAQALTRSGNAFSPHVNVGITPAQAAKMDPAAFLQFAEEVARVAGKLREPKQLRLLEDTKESL